MRTVCLSVLMLVACGTDSGGGGSSDVTSSDAADTTIDSDGKTTFDVPQKPDAPPPPTCKTASECNDGLWCNGEETCSPDSLGAGADGCLAGVAPKGSDPTPGDCTVLGACDEGTKSFPLVKLTTGAACDDGIACTTGDVCAADGSCEGTADPARCDDGLYCNGVESCSAAVGCVAGKAPEGADANLGDCLVPGPCEEATHTFPLIPGDLGKACNDGVDCTFDDACTPAGTCAGAPSDAFCDDDKYCNGAETCAKDAGCVSGLAPKVPVDTDLNDCLAYFACDEVTQSWPLLPAAKGTVCSDGNGCSLGDACTADGTCAGTLDDAQCNDKKVCNGTETCSPGGCVPGTPLVPPVDEDPTDCMAPALVCDLFAGGFPLVPVAVGTPCDDGQSCTLSDACDATGACVGSPDNAECDDGALCNGAETCDAVLGCQAGAPPSPPLDKGCLSFGPCDEEQKGFPAVPDPDACDDQDPCTSDVCSTATGLCEHPDGQDGVDCDDGLATTTAEACHAGQCTCVPVCTDKPCDAPDGCGGKCTAACPL